jgi:hypothetical protein
MGWIPPSCFSGVINSPPVYSSTKDGWKEPVRKGWIRHLRIRLWRSVLSLKNIGVIMFRTCQPSMSVIVTGECVLKYWHILGMLNHLSRNSVPASDDQKSPKFWGCDHNIELRHTGLRSGWAGSGCFVRRISRLEGLSLVTELDVTVWLTLERAPRRVQYSTYTTRA